MAKKKSTKNPIENELLEENELVIPDNVPVLPTVDVVAFPGVMMSLHINRGFSIRAVEQAAETEGVIVVLAQRNPNVEDPDKDGLYDFGVIATVVRTLKATEGRVKVLLQGIVRAKA